MKKFLLIALGIVVVLVAVVVVIAVLAGKEFRPIAEGILRDLEAGKVDQVHAEAADRFREKTSLAEFRRWWEVRRAALGAYRQVLSTTGAGKGASTEAGSTG